VLEVVAWELCDSGENKTQGTGKSLGLNIKRASSIDAPGTIVIAQ
jgi:hypothetical protein